MVFGNFTRYELLRSSFENKDGLQIVQWLSGMSFNVPFGGSCDFLLQS